MDALGILRIRLLCTKDDTPKAEEAPSARAARFGRTSSGCPFLHACVQRLVQALLVASNVLWLLQTLLRSLYTCTKKVFCSHKMLAHSTEEPWPWVAGSDEPFPFFRQIVGACQPASDPDSASSLVAHASCVPCLLTVLQAAAPPNSKA